MKYSAVFADRSFVPVRLPDALEITPTRWSKKDIGGPDLASFSVSGPEAALWALTSWLRYDARIQRADGKLVWWGYINSIAITVGAVTLRYSLDNMTNHVRVSYTKRLEDDTKENDITDWSTDTFSYTYYGTYKDLTLRGGELSTSAANALRDDTLESFKNFGASMDVGSGNAVKATIECRGYWSTLEWRQLTIATANRDYYVPNQYGPYGYGNTYYPFGYQNGSQGDTNFPLGGNDPQAAESIGQAFSVGTGGGVSAQRVKRFEFILERHNDPTVNLTTEMWSSSGGSPSALIASMGSAAGGTLPYGGGANPLPWVPFAHTGDEKPVWIIPGETYQAVIRTGVVTGGDYVSITGMSTGLAAGPAKRRTSIGGAWVAFTTATFSANLKVTTEHSESTLEIGGTAARQIPAQGFQASGSRNVAVSTVKLRMCRGNSPTDNLVLYVCADSSGDPGAVLATSTTVPYTDISDTVFEDVTFTFPTPYLLTPGTQYWLKIARTGSVNANHFYIAAASLDTTTYPYGTCKYYNGSAWVAATPVVDLLFKINFTQETTAAISESISDVGALFTGTDITNASGIYENPAQDGETTALEVINKQLKAGTSNNRRLLAEVDPSRRVRLYEAPASSAGATAYINREGNIVTAVGEVINDTCPVGQWIAPIDVARGGALAPAGAIPLFYLEGVDYNPVSDSVSPRLKGQRDPFDLSGVK